MSLESANRLMNTTRNQTLVTRVSIGIGKQDLKCPEGTQGSLTAHRTARCRRARHEMLYFHYLHLTQYEDDEYDRTSTHNGHLRSEVLMPGGS